MTDNDKPLTEQDQRCLIFGACDVLEEYASSAIFDLRAHAHILREILPGIEKLQAVLDASKPSDPEYEYEDRLNPPPPIPEEPHE